MRKTRIPSSANNKLITPQWHIIWIYLYNNIRTKINISSRWRSKNLINNYSYLDELPSPEVSKYTAHLNIQALWLIACMFKWIRMMDMINEISIRTLVGKFNNLWGNI